LNGRPSRYSKPICDCGQRCSWFRELEDAHAALARFEDLYDRAALRWRDARLGYDAHLRHETIDEQEAA